MGDLRATALRTQVESELDCHPENENPLWEAVFACKGGKRHSEPKVFYVPTDKLTDPFASGTRRGVQTREVSVLCFEAATPRVLHAFKRLSPCG